MTLVIEPTELLARVNGCLSRVWAGKLPNGHEVYVMVSYLAVDDEDRTEELHKLSEWTEDTSVQFLTERKT